MSLANGCVSRTALPGIQPLGLAQVAELYHETFPTVAPAKLQEAPPLPGRYTKGWVRCNAALASLHLSTSFLHGTMYSLHPVHVCCAVHVKCVQLMTENDPRLVLAGCRLCTECGGTQPVFALPSYLPVVVQAPTRT